MSSITSVIWIVVCKFCIGFNTMDGAKFGDGSGVKKTHLKETVLVRGKALKTLTKQVNDSALVLFPWASELFICFDK